jgi:sterol desaturase/sphingolipid hydroxylase (fatty acid hydroxylase superfamily)
MLYFIDLIKGFLLGSAVLSIGVFMDRYLSYNDYKELVENNSTRQLYNQGIQAVKTNLLVLTPISYSIAKQTVIMGTGNSINIVDCILFICIHNFGYFCMHKLMHTTPKLYHCHTFHHKFDRVLIPSIGNATSKREFLLAYVIPSLISSYTVNTNEVTFTVAIYIISFFNLCIHCKPLTTISWIPGFVTPLQHHRHHEQKTTHYSASIVNYDWIFSK